MTDLVINDLEEDVVARLQERAKDHGRSLEEEVLEILREALKDEE